MEAPFTDDGDSNSLLDVLINDDSPDADSKLLSESLQNEVERSLSTLSERERDVIRLFFGIGMNHGLTLDEIGEKFDLTRERVRQIKEKAIRKLKQQSKSKLLKAYLG
jgi:RNA polymerase primary sigma factor